MYLFLFIKNVFRQSSIIRIVLCLRPYTLRLIGNSSAKFQGVSYRLDVPRLMVGQPLWRPFPQVFNTLAISVFAAG